MIENIKNRLELDKFNPSNKIIINNGSMVDVKDEIDNAICKYIVNMSLTNKDKKDIDTMLLLLAGCNKKIVKKIHKYVDDGIRELNIKEYKLVHKYSVLSTFIDFWYWLHRLEF